MAGEFFRQRPWSGRVEDERLVTGRGRFVADAPTQNQAYGVFVRSPYAHARISGIDVSAAVEAPEVIGVLTGEDLVAAGVTNVAFPQPMTGRGGKPLVIPKRPALAHDRVVHVGEPVALVVAESRMAAEDAAEAVVVDYDVLPAVTTPEAAMKEDAAPIWPDAPDNLALDWPGPPSTLDSTEEVAAIIAGAARTVTITTCNQRLTGTPLEPRGATAAFDEATGRYRLRSASQGALPLRGQLASALQIAPEDIVVLTEDVGGSFGLKTAAYPEHAALLVAARRFKRPVHWMSTRGEAFQSDNQARDTETTATLALDTDGRFLALKIESIANSGAYLGSASANTASANFARCLPTVYRIPKIAVDVKCVFTNTLPTAPYRGAGRPEANYLMERLVDKAARETGLEPAAIRRLNMISTEEIPYNTAVGTTYDSGDFHAILEETLRLADADGFARRREDARQGGRLRGFGIACFLEHSGASPQEGARLVFDSTGNVTIILGVQSTGQGHATLFPQFAAQKLGLSADAIKLVSGDSSLSPVGGPSVGSRSTMTAGTALQTALEKAIARGRALAAQEMEVEENAIAFRDGAFFVTGTNQSLSLAELGPRLNSDASVEVPQTFPNGCHIAEVEVDPETGMTAIVAYTAVDDCGVVLDHTMAEGQIVGGLAQGFGQALMERVVYDDEGQIVTGSLMDYALPRAADMPPLDPRFHPVPATTNPLGVKGVGEAGTTGSIAAVMNAIADAIPGGYGASLEMPATPPRVWAACEAARKAGLL